MLFLFATRHAFFRGALVVVLVVDDDDGAALQSRLNTPYKRWLDFVSQVEARFRSARDVAGSFCCQCSSLNRDAVQRTTTTSVLAVLRGIRTRAI